MMTATQNLFCIILLIISILLQRGFRKNFTFEKIHDFSEKKPSEGLEVVILLLRQY